MADDEMRTVLELDVSFLHEFSDKLWFYYAERDHWVGEQREVVLRVLRGTPAEVRVGYGHSDIPHDFSISEQSLNFPRVEVFDTFRWLDHSAEVASQCVKWMDTGGFLGDVGSTR